MHGAVCIFRLLTTTLSYTLEPCFYFVSDYFSVFRGQREKRWCTCAMEKDTRQSS